MKVHKNQEKNPGRVQEVEEAEKAEVEILFVDLCALQPVHEQENAYKCYMFSVEKTLATGGHDKFTARLVF